MSSSTSSFRRELRVLGAVALVLVGAEAVVRRAEQRLSAEVHVPAMARELSSANGLRILFVGNSLVREGVDAEEFENATRALGVERPHAAKLTLLNTLVGEWYYAFKHNFASEGRAPDVVVIGFSANHLEDRASIHVETVARFHSRYADVPAIFRTDVKMFGDRAEFLLAGASASFTHRTSVQRRVLGTFVPSYQWFASELNDSISEQARIRARRRGAAYVPTYNRLARLIRMAKGSGARVFVVAMPIPFTYEVNDSLRNAAEQAGADFVDCRNAQGVDAQSFADRIHLNRAAAKVFSRYLAERLAFAFREMEAQERSGR